MHGYEISSQDLARIEEQARQMRARAVADAFSALRSRLAGMFRSAPRRADA